MEQSELLRKIAATFDALGARYVIVGSMASTAYGEPRLTNDIDVVVDLRPSHVNAFCEAFAAPDYYLSRPAVESAISKKFQFNILHPASGMKVDCIIPSVGEHDRLQLGRGRAITRSDGNYTVVFASPEDVIIKKMEYYREGGSEKHLRDITGVLKMQGDKIDRPYILYWAQKLQLIPVWEKVEERLQSSTS
jgi:hypothetical protein